MIELLTKYNKLRSQLTENVGCEEQMCEVGWNDGIIEAIEELLENVPDDVAKMILLGHL